MALPHHVKRKQYLVCDEAAELEDELVKHFSVDINSKTLKWLLPKFELTVDVDNLTRVKSYLSEISFQLQELCASLKEKVSKKANSGEISKLQQAKNLKEQINATLDNWNNAEYVAEKTKTGIVVQPLKVNKLSDALFCNADKVLLMSATIIDPANFAKSLGIDDYEYIEIPSAFDPSKAPIYCMSKYKVNRDNWLKLMPTFKQIIEQICQQHKDDKGIIHTHNMDITNFMRQNLRDSRFLFREDGIDNQMILDKHMQSTNNSVLVSPSMTHGVDLKDDLARFQIIIKAPFLPLNSKRIMKLFKADAQWYANKMLTTVIQAAGRGVRTKDDHCATYILDGCIVSSILDNAQNLPKYFLKRFK
jgi:Rad3-related DNA helicase